MPDSLSEEAIRQLHFRYKLIADAAKVLFRRWLFGGYSR